MHCDLMQIYGSVTCRKNIHAEVKWHAISGVFSKILIQCLRLDQKTHWWNRVLSHWWINNSKIFPFFSLVLFPFLFQPTNLFSLISLFFLQHCPLFLTSIVCFLYIISIFGFCFINYYKMHQIYSKIHILKCRT